MDFVEYDVSYLTMVFGVLCQLTGILPSSPMT
jgi:hypothetical protein